MFTIGERNFAINKTRFTQGDHQLEVTFIGPCDRGPRGGRRYKFTIRCKFYINFVGRDTTLCGIEWLSITAAEFELNCNADINTTLTIQCDSIGGDIDEDEVICIYNEKLGPLEKCQFLTGAHELLTGGVLNLVTLHDVGSCIYIATCSSRWYSELHVHYNTL